MNQEKLLDLIEKSKLGDRSAQEQLVMTAQNKVYYHCKKFIKNEEDAQDATQDVLITMLTNLEKLREPAAFWGWLNRITANCCKHLLIQGPKEWQILEDEDGGSMLDSIETLDDQAIPDQALDNAETRRLVMEIIDGLPAEQRMTVVFFYYDEMSVKDIASMMEVSEGTVKSRLNYARKSIKLEVEKMEKKGTKLYGISLLPFLGYFLLADAQAQALPAAAAAVITQGAMAGAAAAEGAVSAAGGVAAAGIAGTSADAAAGAAAGAKVGGAISAKVIAGILAGILAVGGIAAGVYAVTHSEPAPPSEPSETAMAAARPDPTPYPSSDPSPEPSEEPRPYAEAYAAKVAELSEQLGADARFGLVHIDGDGMPELVAGTEYIINLYTVTPEGELRTLQEGWVMGRMGPPLYYPGQNAVLVQYDMMMGGDHQELSNTCYRISEDYQFLEYFQDSGEWWPDDDARTHLPALPDELAGLERETLRGDMTAQEILELLGVGSQETVPSEEPTASGEEPTAPNEEPTASGEEPAPDDENRVLLQGTLNIYTYNEVLALQGISDPNPGSDRGETYQLIVLDTPQTLDLLDVEGRVRSGTVWLIAVFNMEQYAGQHLAFSIDPNRIYWPSDTSLPLGAPRTSDIRVLN